MSHETPSISLSDQSQIKPLQIETNAFLKKSVPIPLSPLTLLANLKPIDPIQSIGSSTTLSVASSPNIPNYSLIQQNSLNNKTDGRRSSKI